MGKKDKDAWGNVIDDRYERDMILIRDYIREHEPRLFDKIKDKPLDKKTLSDVRFFFKQQQKELKKYAKLDKCWIDKEPCTPQCKKHSHHKVFFGLSQLKGWAWLRRLKLTRGSCTIQNISLDEARRLKKGH